MPSKTPKQARLMAACAHGAGYESCPPKKVSTEFNQADKGTGILKRYAGGYVKQSKKDVNYHSGHGNLRCHLCTMFNPPHSCTAVAGTIDPEGWCKLFKAKPHKADGGPVEMASGGELAVPIPITPDTIQQFQQNLWDHMQSSGIPPRVMRGVSPYDRSWLLKQRDNWFSGKGFEEYASGGGAGGGETEYKLGPNENPSVVAKKTGVPLSTIMKLNNLDDTSSRHLKVGSILRLKDVPPPPPTKASGPVVGKEVGRGVEPIPFDPNDPSINLPQTDPIPSGEVAPGHVGMQTVTQTPPIPSNKFNPTTITPGDAAALEKYKQWNPGLENPHEVPLPVQIAQEPPPPPQKPRPQPPQPLGPHNTVGIGPALAMMPRDRNAEFVNPSPGQGNYFNTEDVGPGAQMFRDTSAPFEKLMNSRALTDIMTKWGMIGGNEPPIGPRLGPAGGTPGRIEPKLNPIKNYYLTGQALAGRRAYYERVFNNLKQSGAAPDIAKPSFGANEGIPGETIEPRYAFGGPVYRQPGGMIPEPVMPFPPPDPLRQYDASPDRRGDHVQIIQGGQQYPPNPGGVGFDNYSKRRMDLEPIGDVIDWTKYVHSPDLMTDQQMHQNSPFPKMGGASPRVGSPEWNAQYEAAHDLKPGSLIESNAGRGDVIDAVHPRALDIARDVAGRFSRDALAFATKRISTWRQDSDFEKYWQGLSLAERTGTVQGLASGFDGYNKKAGGGPVSDDKEPTMAEVLDSIRRIIGEEQSPPTSPLGQRFVPMNNSPAPPGYRLNAKGGSIKMATGGLPSIPKAKGIPPQSVMVERSAGASMARRASGFLRSAVPGRTDHIPVAISSGSYVIPADVVAGHGQGNSLAGAAALDKLFKQGPYGSAMVKAALPRVTAPRIGFIKSGPMGYTRNTPNIGYQHRADGGGSKVPVMAAGGEYVVHPDIVKAVGKGNPDRGFRVLDQFVLDSRKKHIKTLKGLKPPKKD